MKSSHFFLCLLLTAAWIGSNSAIAQVVWSNPEDGDWFDSDNWDDDIPVPGERAIITEGIAVISQPGAVAGELRVANFGTGTLNLEGNATLTNSISYIGRFANSSGVANVSGGTWTHANNLEVGAAGDGTLNLTGGTITASSVILAQASGSTGTINIGTGTSAGILDTATVNGGSGNATLNFNHNEADYHFTRNGTSGGNTINIEGNIAIQHTGTGTTTLSGNNNHTGGTEISSGTLVVNGNLSGSVLLTSDVLDSGNGPGSDGPGPGGPGLGGPGPTGPPVDGSSGTLAGTGTVGSIILEAGGTLSPGQSAGSLNAESLDWQGGYFVFDLGADSASSDFLSLSGALTGTTEDPLLFTFVDNGIVAGQTYDLIGFGSITLDISRFGYNGDLGGFEGYFSYNSGMDTLQFTVIPEPSTWALFLSALSLILVAGKRTLGQKVR